MKPLPLAAACSLLLACLDSQHGRVGVEDDATPASPSCRAGAPIAHIARPVHAFALGPCGEVVYWHESDARALVLADAQHATVATWPDPNAYGGVVVASPSARRFAATSLRSDLGNGDVHVGPLDTATLALDGPLAFTAWPELRFDAREHVVMLETDFSGRQSYLTIEGEPRLGPLALLSVVGERAFYAVERTGLAPGDDVMVVTRSLADASERELVSLRRAWLEGSTWRTHGAFMVTGDASRLVTIQECQYPTSDECAPTVHSIRASDDGHELLAPERWRGPMVGAGPLVAATTETGMALLDGDGRVFTLAGHAPERVMDDHVLTRRDDVVYALLPDEAPRALASGVVQLMLSPDGRGAALLGHRPDARTQVVSWHGHARAELDDGLEPLAIAAVFDDGVVVVRGAREVLVADADGTALARSEGRCADGITRRGRYLFVALCSRPNDELHRLDLTTGQDDTIAEGHDFDFLIDAEARHVAFTFVPLSGTVRELQAGRL